MDEIRQNVRDVYGKIGASGADTRTVKQSAGSCTPSCCSAGDAQISGAGATSRVLGYSEAELAAVPEGANLGLGCGNPGQIAALQPGETVLDLGSGGGFDCFLAATQVGAQGAVIGVDMTAEMVSLARNNAAKAKTQNVDFRLGEIEHLPVADGTVDVIMSNCVINLSPDKPAVFRDAFRVLKHGGRLAISDVVATAPLPQELRNNLELIAGCMGGAALIEDLESMLRAAGFTEISIAPKDSSHEFIREWDPSVDLDKYVVAADIEARKP